MRWYRLSADQGNASAQNNLGVMYDNGEGVLKDDAEAVRWYRLSADQGNASAQYNLGVSYANGEGVLKDDAEAVRWYRLSADQGTPLRSTTSGSGTPTAAISRRTRQPCAGLMSQPNRGTGLRRATSGSSNGEGVLDSDSSRTCGSTSLIANGDDAAREGRDVLEPFMTPTEYQPCH